jgi:DNA (cytosine-5)-methyltransferase 1
MVDQTAVSLFSGAGGLDLGLEASGWRILAQLDTDPDAIETLERRSVRQRRRPHIISLPVEQVPAQTLRRRLRLRQGQLGLLAGGPPCQPFTTSGLRQAINDRRASSLFPAYLEFVNEFRPHALLLENVDGMLSAALRHRPLQYRGRGHAPLSPEERKGSFLHWLVTALTEL